MTVLEAWHAVVEGENAAIYAYVIAGARSGMQSRAANGLQAHRDQRDQASAIVVAEGGTPPAPEAAYDLPFEVTRAAAATSLLALVDNRLVGLYADAAAASRGGRRRHAVRAGAANATRAVTWGADSQAFPTG